MRIRNLNKKISLTIAILLVLATLHSIVNVSSATSFATIHINLSDDGITVDGKAITEDPSQLVYLAHSTNNGGTSSDATSANIAIDNIVVIRACGVYEFTGSLSNGQIAIDFNELDETAFISSGHVGIILNNANITCKSAPVIFAYNSEVMPDGKELYIQTASGTTNTLTGGKIKQVVQGWSDVNNLKYYVENDEDEGLRYKYDGAVSSDVSIGFGGEGSLTITSTKKEGIECKGNVEFDSGNYEIYSMDDGINACTEHKSAITINGGNVLVSVLPEAEEGDAIDSNGSLTINGGTVVALAHETSGDNGLDSDDGTYINGGYVVATGNMGDGIASGSKQKYIQKTFSSKINKDTLITLTDENNNPIVAFKADRSYSILTVSTPDITMDNIKIFEGGDVEGQNIHGLYTLITSFENGTERTDIGEGGMHGNPGNMQNDVSKIERLKQKRIDRVRAYYIALGVLIVTLVLVTAAAIIGIRKSKK